jgi:hypothetical protein
MISILLYLLFQRCTGPETQYQFGRDEQTLFGGRIHGYTLHLFLHVERAEIGDEKAVPILQFLRHDAKHGRNPCGSILCAAPRPFRQGVDELFIIQGAKFLNFALYYEFFEYLPNIF